MILVAGLVGFLALAVPASTQEEANRHVPMLVQLTGPLESVHYDLGEHGAVTLDYALPGEGVSVPVVVPFPVDPLRIEPLRTAVPEQAEIGDLHPNRRPGWNRLPQPPRSVPPPPDGSTRVGWASIATLLATFLLLVGLRRLPALALLPLAVGGSLIATSLHEQARERSATQVRVYEGRGGSPAWVQVDVGAGWLDVAPDPSGTLTVQPEGAPVHWTVARPEGAARERWSIVGGVHLVRRVEASPGALARGGNELGDLSDVWLRHGDGGWSALADWSHGAPLPDVPEFDPDAADGAPPGWLAEGLPQGVEVVVGRLTPGQDLGRSARPDEEGRRRVDPETWVRVVDLR